MEAYLQEGHQSTRISQESWYLDIVSKNSEVLKTKDHLFTLPYRNIFGIKQLIIPPYVQRLDPFALHTDERDIEFPLEVISRFPCGYLSVTKLFNNTPAFVTLQARTNYILDLNRSYEAIVANYHKGHKLNIKQANKNGITISESGDAEVFAAFYSNYSHASIPSKYKNKTLISELVSTCMSQNAGTIYKAVNKDSKSVAYTFITNYNGSLTYLLSCSDTIGKELFSMYAIIDEVIRRHAGSQMILDFEGSMIPGIAYFMKGFGAEEETYYVYEWNEHWVCKMKNILRKMI